jgi:hypothetical protein
MNRVNRLIRYGKEKTKADGVLLGLVLVFRILIDNFDSYIRKLEFRKRNIPSILITTLPKSGSMYIQNSLERRCGLHSVVTGEHGFPYSPLNEAAMKKFAIGCAVDQGHYMPSVKNLSLLKKHGINKIVVHCRDPRQALVSWVHYVDKYHSEHNLFDAEDIDIPLDYFEKSFEEKIDIMIELYYPFFVEFVDRWLAYRGEGYSTWGIEVLFTEFKSMKSEPDEFFDRICEFYGIQQVASSQLRQDSTAAHSHDRKGELEEWRQTFNSEQIKKTSAKITDEMFQQFGWSRA